MDEPREDTLDNTLEDALADTLADALADTLADSARLPSVAAEAAAPHAEVAPA